MSSDEIEILLSAHEALSAQISRENGKRPPEEVVKDFLSQINMKPIRDFPTDVAWFNVTEPLTFSKHLKGKLVLLDFFTYCCINCMHILPDLKDIENEFSVEDGLVVIGVHSPKFVNEKVPWNVQSAVQKYNISHPVVNDIETVMWNECNISCWPSLLLLSPIGSPLILLMGEGHKDVLHLYIRSALAYFKSKNQISNHTLPIQSSFQLLPELKGPLLFPGKITNYIDKDNNNKEIFALSDTGNNRILVINPDGFILHVVGGICGFQDGDFKEAKFNAPQGLVFQNEHVLFVADTENHAIRKIDFKEKTVETVAGTGEQGIDRSGGNLGPNQELSSPWDLVLFRTADMDMSFHLPDEEVPQREVLLIAMAGTHQIWALFLDELVWWKFKRQGRGICMCVAGSGREENRNNMYPHSAAFAQPSGLTLNQEAKELYIADSESSSIRCMSLKDGRVTPLVGGSSSPTNLFAYGDLDGKLFEAKLQHPLGLAKGESSEIYVADTYNHKIKIVNTASQTITTSVWSKDNSHNFNEPSGLCFNGDKSKLYVCDTNNHCIKVIDMKSNCTEQAVTKLELKLNTDSENQNFVPSSNIVKTGKVLEVNKYGGKIILTINVLFLDGLSLTSGAPQKWYVRLPNETWSSVPRSGCNVKALETVINLPRSSTETCRFYVDYSFIVCKDNTCEPRKFHLEFYVNFKESGMLQISEKFQLKVGTDRILV